MPLSEEELRLLEQMERALVQEDPKLASTLRGTTFRRSARRRAILGGIGFLVGIGLLMTGAISRVYPVGILGFVVMLAAAVVGLTALRGQQAMGEEPVEARETRHHGFGVVDGGRQGRHHHRPRRSTASFMERMEERWRKRRETGGW